MSGGWLTTGLPWAALGILVLYLSLLATAVVRAGRREAPQVRPPTMDLTTARAALTSRDAVRATEAAVALAHLDDADAFAALVGALGRCAAPPAHVSALVRRSAFRGDRVPALTEVVDHPDPEVRRRVADLLGATGASGASAPLVQLAHDPDPRVRARAVAAILELPGDGPSAELAAALTDGDGGVRAAAARAAGRHPHRSSPAQLAARLTDTDWEVRCAAAEALARTGATAELRAALRNDDPAARTLAAAALARWTGLVPASGGAR